MKYHYIYFIKFDTGHFYIGSRSSILEPEKDTKYWGSPVTYKSLWKDPNLKKTKHILRVCKDEYHKRELETKLIKEAWQKYDSLCLNRNAAPVFHIEACKRGAQKSAEVCSKSFTIKSPEGKIYTSKNIRKFCREHDLDFRSLSKVINRQRSHHWGWTLP